MGIADALSKSEVSELNLSNNGLTAEGAKYIFLGDKDRTILEEGKRRPRPIAGLKDTLAWSIHYGKMMPLKGPPVKSLNLQDNSIGDEGANHIAEWLQDPL